MTTARRSTSAPRDAVERMPPYEPPDSALGEQPPRIILDANENPYGPSPRVKEALAAFDRYHRYPDPDQKTLRGLIARYVGVERESVVVGNGSDELIDLLCRIYLEPGDEVINCTPTFGMYQFSADLCGGTTVEVPRDDAWNVRPQDVRRALSPRSRIIFLATPNNPTGNQADEALVADLLDTGCVVVLDEAYVEFASRGSTCQEVSSHPNLVVLRTFSKWAGLAGLRVGYGVFPSEIRQSLLKVKPPFSVNLAAEAAVEATFLDLPLVQERIGRIVSERDRMAERLAEVPGLKVWPSDGNFVLVTAGAATDRGLKAHLKNEGIAVRAYSHPRLKGSVRISAGLAEHTDALLESVHRWSAS